jgi:hypothetical protein
VIASVQAVDFTVGSQSRDAVRALSATMDTDCDAGGNSCIQIQVC